MMFTWRNRLVECSFAAWAIRPRPLLLDVDIGLVGMVFFDKSSSALWIELFRLFAEKM